MKRLLMIDDDEKLVSLVRKYLEPQGFEVEAVFDGEAGLAAARDHEPALVILDLMLPGLDGLEVCRRLREHSRVPVLMLTARGDETDRIVGLELGADDYLPKPFNPRELLARIRAILRRSEALAEDLPAATRTIRVGPLAVDPASRTVAVDGSEVILTTTEFDLLHALAASAGRVLSREQLMDRIYGGGWQAYDRSIDVHISRIRHKIGDDPRQPRLLKTVRGIGYQLARVEES
jgi:DNA-binding response OmpR family regulator